MNKHQHMTGIKGNSFIVIINENMKAPIFQVVDVGIKADILELLPELTEKVKEIKEQFTLLQSVIPVSWRALIYERLLL